MATTERTHESGMNVRVEVQVIGDRVVVNPRTRVAHLHDFDGNVVDTVRLSLEVCGCGYSFARPGVGYRGTDGWHCKRCGQMHTLDRGSVANDATHLTPDASLVRRFDAGMSVPPDRSTPSDLEASH